MTTNVRFCLSHGPSDDKKNAQNIFLKITAFHSQAEQLTTKDSIVLRNKNSSHIV